MYWLIALDGKTAGSRFALMGPCLVGRGGLNHIVIEDPRVSRQHAKLTREGEQYWLYDLNSANGTFLNGDRIKREPIQPGDVVSFGPFQFRFEFEQAPESIQRTVQIQFDDPPTPTSTNSGRTIIDAIDAASNAAGPHLFSHLTELEDASRKLAVLYKFLQSNSEVLKTEALIEKIITSFLEFFPIAELVSIYLPDKAKHMVYRKGLRRNGEDAPSVFLADDIHEEVVQKKRSIITTSPLPLIAVNLGPYFGGSSMYAPMMTRGDVQGVIWVQAIGRAEVSFNQRDLDLLTGLANVATLALQNTRLYESSLEQQRLSQDLLFAKQVQTSFLPKQLPYVQGYEFVTMYQPAFSVGGDFYDVFWIDQHQVAIFIGDVAGKGVSAALLMARITSDLKAAIMADARPSSVMKRMNQILLERQQHDIFVTGLYLCLDIRTGRIVFSNAGHLPPLIHRQRTRGIERVYHASSTPIGVLETEQFEEAETALERGDVLLLYTDGVIEDSDEHGGQFGFDRLERSFSSSHSAEQAIQGIFADMQKHVGAAQKHKDDITLIACGVQG